MDPLTRCELDPSIAGVGTRQCFSTTRVGGCEVYDGKVARAGPSVWCVQLDRYSMRRQEQAAR